MNLADLVSPRHTALLTMEMQEGVLGKGALMPALAEQATAAGLRQVVSRLCRAARLADVRVVHCTAQMRSDGRGLAENCRIFARANRMRRENGPLPTDAGQPGTAVVAEIGAPDDIVVARMQAMTPFTTTELDYVLRNMGIRTVVVTGVSVNLGVFGMCLSAVDLGYQVVLVRDGVAGVPAEYADSVIEHSLSLITTVARAGDLVEAWKTA